MPKVRGNEGLLQCMLQKTLKQGVGKWCPSTTGPLLPTMTDSLLAPAREVLYKRYHTGELVPATILGPSDVWCLCHVFEDTLYLTRGLMEDSAVPSNLSVPKVSNSDGAATSARAKESPKPGEHAQLFRMKRDRNKGFYSEKC